MRLSVGQKIFSIAAVILALMIVGDGEGHELVERHAVVGIDVVELG